MVVNNVPYMHINVRVLILASGFFFTVLTLLFKGAAIRKRQYDAKVVIECGSNAVTFSAMHDSGNTLTDPVSGIPVLIADSKALQPLWRPEIRSLLTGEALRDPSTVLLALNALELPAKFRLIPYKAIGTDSGFLLGFKPDKITVNDKPTELFAALSPTSIEKAIVNLS